MIMSGEIGQTGHPHAGKGQPGRPLKANKIRAFLDVLRKGVTVSTAGAELKIERSTLYSWRSTNPEFQAAWDEAIEIGNDFLEDVIRKHAAKDWRAAEALLKARRPKQWNSTRLTHAGDPDNPVKVDVTNREAESFVARQEAAASRLAPKLVS